MQRCVNKYIFMYIYSSLTQTYRECTTASNGITHVPTNQWKWLQVHEKKYQYANLNTCSWVEAYHSMLAPEISIHKVFLQYSQQFSHKLCYSVLCKQTWLTSNVTKKFYVPTDGPNQTQYILEAHHSET